MTDTISSFAQAERRTPEERKAIGKETRRRTPLDSHAAFEPAPGRIVFGVPSTIRTSPGASAA